MNDTNDDSSKPNALIIGSNGTIGKAIVEEFEKTHRVVTLSREQTDYTEEDLRRQSRHFQSLGEFNRIVCCTGVLHDQMVSPEKNLGQIDSAGLAHYFHVNAIVPIICIKHFYQLLGKQDTAVFACLSAMVGSIEDNRLGGWYGYRGSKAALNMLVKTAAIEVARTNKKASIVAIHPGTTMSELSRPFSTNVKPDKYYTPRQTAQRIYHVMNKVSAKDSGLFFNWNGERLPW